MYGATTGWRVARTRATLAATKCCTSGWSADGRPGRSRTTGRSACRSNPRTRHVPTSASSTGSWRTRTSPKRSSKRASKWLQLHADVSRTSWARNHHRDAPQSQSDEHHDRARLIAIPWSRQVRGRLPARRCHRDREMRRQIAASCHRDRVRRDRCCRPDLDQARSVRRRASRIREGRNP